MKRKLSAFLALVLALIMIIGSFTLSVSAAYVSVSYQFTGAHASDKGFAQGTITLSADSNSGCTCMLFWADDNMLLPGFDPICTLTAPNGGSASFSMPENTAIPAKATKLAAMKGTGFDTSNNIGISNAAATYALPSNKTLAKTDSDLLYSFASYSDMHISSDEEGSSSKYPYDVEHLTKAFNVAAARNVDFIISTGDHVNNQRADSKGGANPFYPEEWNTYLKTLAQSDFTGPVYEAIGNHELWCYDTESDYNNKDWKTGSDYFRAVTGLDSTAATMNTGKAYYEITEPVTGDHFLFMALEGGFYTDRVNEFSDAQLTWLDNKLTQYETDGKNIFILEHANFEKWGAGDSLTTSYYNLPLKDSSSSSLALKNLLKKHKSAVLICGHTHFKFDLDMNYSTNSATSATIIHNSSVGAVRDIVNGARQDDTSRELTEGYIVEVYDNATIFQGTNLYYNKINPVTTYIVPQTTSSLKPPATEPAPTEPPTNPPTNPPTTPPTNPPTDPPVPTDPPATEPPVIKGDANDDGDVSIDDATYIQRYDVDIPLPHPINLTNSDVDNSGLVDITDATWIQRYLADIIQSLDGIGTTAATGSKGDYSSTGAELRSTVKTALDNYWLLASYDQYQTLKKAYKENADENTLSAAKAEFDAAVTAFYPGDSVDIYFSNNVGWSDVYAYCSAGHGKDKNASWPGQKMTYVTTNSYGEKIYKINVPTAKYNFIIFTNNSQQTVDLPLGVTKNQGFYYNSSLGKDSLGHYRCSSYVYK